MSLFIFLSFTSRITTSPSGDSPKAVKASVKGLGRHTLAERGVFNLEEGVDPRILGHRESLDPVKNG